MPSGVASVQAHSSSVSVNAVGNGSGTFDVEITENGKTRKLTGLSPGAKGFIEIPSGPNGEATIVIDPKSAQGGASIKVEGKPLILPSRAAAAQAKSRNVAVMATANGSGTFDVEITEDGKTRKLTGVKAKPDGTLDIPELNDAAPAGATISKQVKIINGTSNVDSHLLPTIIDGFKNEDVKVIVNGTEISGAAGNVIAPSAAITVTTDGLAGVGEIVKSGRVVAGHPLTEPFIVDLAAAHPSKEVLIEAKLVNGKKVVAAPKITVTSGQKAKIQAGDVWLSLHATISPAGTISLKGDAGSAKAPKGPGFSVNGLASGGSFNYGNGAAGTWEIKASLSGGPMPPVMKTIIMKSAKP
jgi:archaellum component FlaF (FlaF/FlaG flagellin family)